MFGSDHGSKDDSVEEKSVKILILKPLEIQSLRTLKLLFN